MKLDDPPHKLAMAFSLGVFVAFTPTIGFHIISCFLFAWLFRVSKFVVLTASFINNPWTIVPIYGFCLWLGVKITGSDIETPQIAWDELTFANAFGVIKPYIWPFIAGTLVIGAISAIISYFLFHWAVMRYRRTPGKGMP